jgi:hypothetical protein
MSIAKRVMGIIEEANVSKLDKLQKLIRYHRQHVFDDNGDLHTKAIDRLKKTKIFIDDMEQRRHDANVRRGDELIRQGY